MGAHSNSGGASLARSSMRLRNSWNSAPALWVWMTSLVGLYASIRRSIRNFSMLGSGGMVSVTVILNPSLEGLLGLIAVAECALDRCRLEGRIQTVCSTSSDFATPIGFGGGGVWAKKGPNTVSPPVPSS